MARNVVLNLIGNNRTSRAFRGAARDADEAADRIDRLGGSSSRAGSRLAFLTGRTATLGAGLLALAPAAQAATAAVVAGAGAMTAAFGSAALAGGAFALAVKPQLSAVGEAAKAAEKAQAAQAAGGKTAAAANQAYQASLAKLPPATRQTAVAFIGLKSAYKDWSNSLAGDTMPIFTRGLNIARGLLPKLTPLVKTAADALGDFMKGIERGSKSKGFAGFLKRVNEAAKTTLPALLRSAKNVGVGVAGIFDAFLPHAGAMATGVEGLTEKFAEWGQALKTSESFKQFIAYVRQHLPALATTFGNLVQIVVNLATAFAPLSGISLELVKNFTGLLAALPPPVLTVLAGGFIAVTTAVRILTPVMRVLNIVMRLNPIGLVVLALAGLVAGLIYAYKHSETFRQVVDRVWSAVKIAVSGAWTKWIRPALLGLGDLLKRAYQVWQEKWPPLQQLLGEIAAFFRDKLKGAIDVVSQAFDGMSGAAQTASGKVAGVGQGFQTTKQDGNKFLSWSQFWGAALGLIFGGAFGGIAGYLTVTFWPQLKNQFKLGFKTLGRWGREFAGSLPGTLRKGLTGSANAVRSGLGLVKRTFFDGLPPIRADWRSLWNWVHAFLKRLMSVSVGSLRHGLSLMRGAFSRGVDAIKSAWRRLPASVRAPINWVINVGYNRGIRKLWNKVMGWLHLPGGLQLGQVQGLAAGGALAGPAAAAPMRVNRPTAIVGEGSRKHPEFVIPTDPKYRGRAQALWAAAGGQLQMLAKGGVLGSVLGTVKKLAGKVAGIGRAGMDLLADPKAIWDRLARKMVPGSGHLAVDSWGTAMSKIVPQLLDRAWSAASQVINTFKKAFGGSGGAVVKAAASMIGRGDDRGENNNWLTRAWGMPGAPWCAMFVSEAIKQARAQRRYRGYPSAAVASYVGAMRHVGHGEGRPGDLGAYRGTGHINVIARNLGGGVYETIGGNEGPRVQRSRRGGQSAILRPMARGGVLGIFTQRNLDPADERDPLLRALRGGVRVATYDDGGMLMPGATLALNHTGRPETVRPTHRAADAAYHRDAPLVETLNVNHVPGYSTPADLLRGLRHAERSARYHRRG